MTINFDTTPTKKIRFLAFLPVETRSAITSSLIINFLILLISGFFFPNLQKEIPLFYSMPGDQQLVNREWLFILPAFSSLLTMIHLLIMYVERKSEINILRMFASVTLLMQILALAILLRIIIITN